MKLTRITGKELLNSLNFEDVADKQLAHSRKEHKAILEQERRAIGEVLSNLLDDDNISVHDQSVELLEIIEALKQGELPEGIKTTGDRTKLHEFGSPKGLPKGWRGRVLKSANEPEGIKEKK